MSLKSLTLDTIEFTPTFISFGVEWGRRQTTYDRLDVLEEFTFEISCVVLKFDDEDDKSTVLTFDGMRNVWRLPCIRFAETIKVFRFDYVPRVEYIIIFDSIRICLAAIEEKKRKIDTLILDVRRMNCCNAEELKTMNTYLLWGREKRKCWSHLETVDLTLTTKSVVNPYVEKLFYKIFQDLLHELTSGNRHEEELICDNPSGVGLKTCKFKGLFNFGLAIFEQVTTDCSKTLANVSYCHDSWKIDSRDAYKLLEMFDSKLVPGVCKKISIKSIEAGPVLSKPFLQKQMRTIESLKLTRASIDVPLDRFLSLKTLHCEVVNPETNLFPLVRNTTKLQKFMSYAVLNTGLKECVHQYNGSLTWIIAEDCDDLETRNIDLHWYAKQQCGALLASMNRTFRTTGLPVRDVWKLVARYMWEMRSKIVTLPDEAVDHWGDF